MSSILTAGNNNFIYFDMDQVCVGLRQQSFDYGGIVDDASMSTLEAADAETRPVENASDCEAYNDNTLPRKFYRIRIELPRSAVGNLNVRLKTNECISYSVAPFYTH